MSERQGELLLNEPDSRVVGFEFLVRENGADRWVTLQGHGGTLGAGFIAVSEHRPVNIREAKEHLIGQARRLLKRNGHLREYRDAPDPADRIHRIEPSAVLNVREVRT